MSQQIIGLDMGAHSVKATLLRSRLRGFELAGFYQRPVVVDESVSEEDRMARTVEQLLAENRLKADGVVVSMPGLVVSVRIITLPFTDRRKISRVVPYEMEGYLPFSLEEVVISYHILKQAEGKTRLLVVALRKDLLKVHLEALAKVGVVPRVVDVDFMALFSLCQTGLKQTGGCYALLDLGDTKTSVCIVHDGSLGFGRSIPIGGRAVSEAIEEEFDLSYEEAKRLKEIEGFLPMGSQTDTHVEKKRLEFSTSLEDSIVDCDAVFIAVGTPPDEDGSADLQYVLKVAEDVGNYMQDYLVVVTKSTVPIKTAEKVRAKVKETLLKRGADIPFDVASNPEFLKEGAAINDTFAHPFKALKVALRGPRTQGPMAPELPITYSLPQQPDPSIVAMVAVDKIKKNQKSETT